MSENNCSNLLFKCLEKFGEIEPASVVVVWRDVEGATQWAYTAAPPEVMCMLNIAVHFLFAKHSGEMADLSPQRLTADGLALLVQQAFEANNRFKSTLSENDLAIAESLMQKLGKAVGLILSSQPKDDPRL